MRSHFDEGELKSVLASLKKSQIKKFASAEGEQGPVEQAMDTITRVSEYLDEKGMVDVVDELSTATATLLSAIRKTAEEKEEEESMFEVDCPYCDKSFKVVVELEDVETEVEEAEDEPGKHPVSEEAKDELEKQEEAEKE